MTEASGTGESGLGQARPYDTVTVIGAGAWGTALAAMARRAGRTTRIWGRTREDIEAFSRTGRNDRYLNGVALPEGIEPMADLEEALAGTGCVLLVTPSRSLREMCGKLKGLVPEGAPVVLCAKGIEQGTGKLLSEVAAEELPGHVIGALSGPTFARETAMNHPTAVTLAFEFTPADRREPSQAPASRLATSLGSNTFRPYISDDLTGVEVAGAVKNVIAIACGMMTGAGYAENTRAALITWGLDEMKTLAEALGGRRETVTGLAGTGDLTLTCSSPTSRNMKLGLQLGQGIPRDECFGGQDTVVEGEVNAVSVNDLAERIGVELPVCRAVHDILHEGADLRQTFTDLWGRPLVGEPKALNVALDHPSHALERAMKAAQ
ncbi:NAD(P)H-dependent glycerol-3-phosphate dehydrogenase [Tropicimonas sp. IMCC34011]|uniref:NAD(P)H-dependent glycerol-3-phosphate dehydrogenase n=1 Tax=Tropicimonas sp. IMCC34011 TaxID=2248759 RepID=UPI000E2592E2|nr:NAD(P)H-dependent glycerol-3-phosphate dehydrogenase [Tropicimonas sp. IMCC34011]